MGLGFLPRWIALFFILHGIHTLANLIVILLLYSYNNSLGFLIILSALNFIPTYLLILPITYLFVNWLFKRNKYDFEELKFPWIIASLFYLFAISVTNINNLYFEGASNFIGPFAYMVIVCFLGFLILTIQTPKINETDD